MIALNVFLFPFCPLAVDASAWELVTRERVQTIKDKYRAVADRLDAVEGALEFDTVARLGADIDSLPLAPKEDPEWRNWRRAKLELWLGALDLIDRTKDQAFNPDDAPERNVAPPPGTTISAGGAPGAIRDPKLRQEYEQAIKRNEEKAKRYLLQRRIPSLDRQWAESVKRYISIQYATETQDVNEIRSLIDRRLSRDKRREQILTFVMQRGGTQR